MTALYAAVLGMAATTPVDGSQWYDMHAWVEDHPGWTFAAYRAARAGDILSHADFLTMRHEAQKKAMERAERE